MRVTFETAAPKDYLMKTVGTKMLDAYHSREHSPSKKMTLNKLVSHIEKGDPSPGKNYLPWLGKMYARGHYLLEDLPTLHKSLDIFHRHKGKLPEHLRNIDSHRTVGDFYKAVSPLEKRETPNPSSGEDEKFFTKQHAISFYKDADTHIVIPLTMKASQHFGSGTKWCTTAKKKEENAFEGYFSRGPLYYIKHKGRKFAYHWDDGDPTIYNEQDEPANAADTKILHSIPGVKRIVEHKKELGFKPYKPSK